MNQRSWMTTFIDWPSRIYKIRYADGNVKYFIEASCCDYDDNQRTKKVTFSKNESDKVWNIEYTDRIPLDRLLELLKLIYRLSIEGWFDEIVFPNLEEIENEED